MTYSSGKYCLTDSRPVFLCTGHLTTVEIRQGAFSAKDLGLGQLCPYLGVLLAICQSRSCSSSAQTYQSSWRLHKCSPSFKLVEHLVRAVRSHSHVCSSFSCRGRTHCERGYLVRAARFTQHPCGRAKQGGRKSPRTLYCILGGAMTLQAHSYHKRTRSIKAHWFLVGVTRGLTFTSIAFHSIDPLRSCASKNTDRCRLCRRFFTRGGS